MARSSDTPYLRLVEAPRIARREMTPSQDVGALLGFVDMSTMSDDAFETILSRVKPSWVFDLRPVPYFDIGRLNRRRVFDLFRTHHASYRDVAGALHITEHNDASMNSGAVGRALLDLMATRPAVAAVMILVDGDEFLDHARHVLPQYIDGCVACSLDVDQLRPDGEPDVVARTRNGQFLVIQAKSFGHSSVSSGQVVEAFQFWCGDAMFAITLEFDDGHAVQVALPRGASTTFADHLDAAIAGLVLREDGISSRTTARRNRAAHDEAAPMHVVALRVESVGVQVGLDNESILITFAHRSDETRAIFSIDGARKLRTHLHHVDRG